MSNPSKSTHGKDKFPLNKKTVETVVSSSYSNQNISNTTTDTSHKHGKYLADIDELNSLAIADHNQSNISENKISNTVTSDLIIGDENKRIQSIGENVNSWLEKETVLSNILRDCSDSSFPPNETTVGFYSADLRNKGHISNIKTNSDNLISISDNEPLTRLPPSSAATSTSVSYSSPTSNTNQINNSHELRVQYQSLSNLQTGCEEIVNVDNQELRNHESGGRISIIECDKSSTGTKSIIQKKRIPLVECSSDEDDLANDACEIDDDDHSSYGGNKNGQDNNWRFELTLDDDTNSKSRFKFSYLRRLYYSFNQGFFGRINFLYKSNQNSSNYSYTSYEDKDLLTGTRKYKLLSRRKHNSGRTFRGSYKYSRSRITMAILKKLVGFLIQRSTLALFGAFLIHITLGTVYTLSNINSYMTSYMRKHGSPEATYGGSMWISSMFAVGQGFSMILGGYIEKRYSAKLACILGCALHSLSIISTSWSIDYGPNVVLFTYGFLPGFGCGLAYMTPMSNGFGWFPNRRGLVAGVILAGFGIGTFIFNMAQTAIVNPDNLSPPDESFGYFTQDAVLDRVPKMFVMIGSIYAAMQFVGCCLLFKPPSVHGSVKASDEHPILIEADDISLKRCIRRREFIVLFVVYGVTTQGVLFVNAMVKEYGQIYIGNDMYLAWTGSMDSIANSLGRLLWGLAIDRFTFTQCFTSITILFLVLMFMMPFELILSSKLSYLLCTLGIFGSFSGWMSTYPVHISRVFGRTNSGMIYGLIFVSQSLGGIITAIGAQYLIDHYNRFIPFFCVVFLEILGLLIYHLFYPK